MDLIFKPADGYPAFYQMYMDNVPNDGKLLHHLQDIGTETGELVSLLSEERLLFRYSENKWTIKDILVHLSDCERILVYRILRIGRGDQTPLPGFDEDLFASTANANNRFIEDIIRELYLVREATLVFLQTLDEASLDRTGTANNNPLSARLLVNHIYGHHRHHLNIIRERYLNEDF